MRIDEQLCIHCGLCMRVCPKVVLFGPYEGGLPNETICFRCGQCQSVCPTGALELEGLPTKSKIAEIPTAAMELQAVRQRHSVRVFRQQPVEESVLQDILEAGACAPSGSNRHPVSIIVVQETEHMDWLRTRAGQLLQERAVLWSSSQDEVLRNRGKYFSRICGERPEGAIKDPILFHAPTLLLAVAEPQFLCDAAMTMASMERLIYAHGLGGVYCGFFTNAVNGDEEVHEYLGMDKKEEILLSFAVGTPKYTYRNAVPRKPLKVTRF